MSRGQRDLRAPGGKKEKTRARARSLNKLRAGGTGVALIDVNGVSHKSSILPLRAVGGSRVEPAPRGGPAPAALFSVPLARRASRISHPSNPRASTLRREPSARPLRRSVRPSVGPSARPSTRPLASPVLLFGRRADLLSLVRIPPPAADLTPTGIAVLVPRTARLGEATTVVAIARGRGATVRGKVAKRGHRLAPPLAGARSSLPSAYSIRRSFSSLRLRGASVPCAPVRPQARKFALRHAAQALSTRALIGHVRQAGSPHVKRGTGAARASRRKGREKERFV